MNEWRGLLFTTAALALAAVAAGQDRPSRARFAITDVTLIDGSGAPPRMHETVVVEDGRITSVGSSSARPPAGADTVSGAGFFLIPGLWDMHTHLAYAGDVACPTLVANGVTGVRDPGGELEVVDWLQSRITGGTLAGLRIFRAGLVAWRTAPSPARSTGW